MSPRCGQCGRGFDNSQGLRIHELRIHGDGWDNQPKSRSELIDGMEELAEELGQAPIQKEMNERGRYSADPYKREFGSWFDALRAAGFDEAASKRSPPAKKPWKDPELLQEMYHDQGMSLRKIAAELNCGATTVRTSMEKHGIDRRRKFDYRFKNYCPFYTEKRGYESWVLPRKDGSKLRVHRLLAIASGADPEKVFSGEYDVHHKNGIPWDNRTENIELLTRSEHNAISARHQSGRTST